MRKERFEMKVSGVVVLLLMMSVVCWSAHATVLWESSFETSPDDDWDSAYITGAGASVTYNLAAAYSGSKGSDSYVASNSGEGICRGIAHLDSFVSERHVRVMVNVGSFAMPDGGQLSIVRDVGSKTQVYLRRAGSEYQMRLRAFWDGGNEYSAPVVIDKSAWHQIDIYIKNETALGSSDGITMWWLDGSLCYSKTDCAAIEDTDAWVLGIASEVAGDTEEYGHIYVDDLQVWDNLVNPTGQAPVVSDESPADGEDNVSVWLSQLTFKIEDPDGDPMDYIVTTIPDIGSAVVTGVSDGTYSVNVSGLDSGTTYTWFVDVSDGSSSTTREFTFTTGLNLPEITNESPKDGAYAIDLNPVLSADIISAMGGPLVWEIQLQNGDTWQIVNSGVLQDGNGHIAASTCTINEFQTRYNWRVQVYDTSNGLLVSKEFTFKTKKDKEEFQVNKLKIKRKTKSCQCYSYRYSCFSFWRWSRSYDCNTCRGAIEIKGTFESSGKVNLKYEDVMYIVKDGEGHSFSFTIPAGSFKKYGCSSNGRYRYRSPCGSTPSIDATFDYKTCEFMFRAKGVCGTEDITGTSITVKLAMGPYLGRDTVEVKTVCNDLVYENEEKDDKCPDKPSYGGCFDGAWRIGFRCFYSWLNNWCWR